MVLCTAAVHGQFDSDSGDRRGPYQTCLDSPATCKKL